jgi:hypothetical protein
MAQNEMTDITSQDVLAPTQVPLLAVLKPAQNTFILYDWCSCKQTSRYSLTSI